MRIMSNLSDFVFVAPFAGAWIEITINWGATVNVAPFAGAWIEMLHSQQLTKPLRVAPFAGAWIEIITVDGQFSSIWSLPSRERGLKCAGCIRFLRPYHVAPFAGAWIEMT